MKKTKINIFSCFWNLPKLKKKLIKKKFKKVVTIKFKFQKMLTVKNFSSPESFHKSITFTSWKISLQWLQTSANQPKKKKLHSHYLHLRLIKAQTIHSHKSSISIKAYPPLLNVYHTALKHYTIRKYITIF